MNTRPVFACAAYLAIKIQDLEPAKSIEGIAREAGLKSAATLEAILSGEVALPIDRIFNLARAVHCDAAELFKLAAKDWRLHNSLLPMIAELDEFKVTAEELHLLTLVRKRLADRDLITTNLIEEWVEAFPLEAS